MIYNIIWLSLGILQFNSIIAYNGNNNYDYKNLSSENNLWQDINNGLEGKLDQLNGFSTDSKGNVYLSTKKSGIYKWNGTSWEFFYLHQINIE